MATKQKCETITIQVPIEISDFIKNLLKQKPAKWIETHIIEDIEATINSMQGEEWAQLLGLTPIFETSVNAKNCEVKGHD